MPHMPVRDFWNCLESLLRRFYMLSKVVPTGNAHFIVSGELGIKILELQGGLPKFGK